MKHIKKIELIFENCEHMDVTNAVGDFYIGEVTKEVYRVASNAISTVNSANLINFQIYGNGEIKGYLFDNIKPIDRLLEYNDITSIELTYTDDTKESFYPSYDGEELNDNQTMKMYKGDVFIVISPDKTVDDIYTDEVMESYIESKDFCMDESVTALNNLLQNNWTQIYKQNDYVQLFNKDLNTNIIISKDFTNILFTDINKNYIIPNKVMYDICTLVFNLCLMRGPLTEDKINEYKYINMNKNSSFKYDAEGEIKVEFNFKLSKTINANLTFNRIHDNGKKLLDGNINIEDNILYVNDVYNFMWLLHEYVDDNFWR